MRVTRRTLNDRRGRVEYLPVLGLIITSVAAVVALAFSAGSILSMGLPGGSRIGVANIGTGSAPVWLPPGDEITTTTEPTVDGTSDIIAGDLAGIGFSEGGFDHPFSPGTPANGGLQGPATSGPSTHPIEWPGDDDPPPPPDPVDNTVLARVDSSVATGGIQLQSFGASGTSVMALSLAVPEPPASCATDKSNRIVVPVRSSDESVATVTPESLSFDCVGFDSITIHPAAPGNATIHVGRPTAAPKEMKLYVKAAAFAVEVSETPPLNSEPTIRVPRPVIIEADRSDGTTFAWKSSGTDPEDGILPSRCTPSPGSLFSIGTTTITCAVTDSGGLTDTATFDVMVVDGPVDTPGPGGGDEGGTLADVDKPYAPTVSLPPADAVDERGWWYGDRVQIKVTHNGDRVPLEGMPSGVDRSSFAHIILVNQEGRQTISGITVKDRAGNESNPAPEVSFNIDRDLPTIELNCPEEPVDLGDPASASWIAADAGSGLATDPTGTLELNTERLGTFSATAPADTAVDKVGHVGQPARCSYTVQAPEPTPDEQTEMLDDDPKAQPNSGDKAETVASTEDAADEELPTEDPVDPEEAPDSTDDEIVGKWPGQEPATDEELAGVDPRRTEVDGQEAAGQ